ncbi:cytochrome b561 domain-containing protein 2-like isoform X2 [Belonocnema kinseyi]|nr:cytochrome b561 domain-containing protein 2-like isoform X2 [Belonocnema kinseyi]
MKTEHASGKEPPGSLTLGFSFLTHLLLVLPILYILVVGFHRPEKLFSWHPICMALGTLIILEAVFSISGEALLTHRLSRPNRITIHWIMLTIGLLLILCGFIIAIVNKNLENKNHFESFHSIWSLITIILAASVALFGVAANNTRWLYPRVRPVLIKVLHALGGIMITILFITAIISGTYRNWLKNQQVGDHELGRQLVFASLFIGGILVLFKPILGAVSRTAVLVKTPQPST